MSILIEPMATVLSNYALLSRGELLVGLQGRQWEPTERHPPGEAARELAQDNARAQLLIDDGSMAANAENVRPALPTPCSISKSRPTLDFSSNMLIVTPSLVVSC